MYVKKTHSTNTLMRELIAIGEAPEFIYAGYQTAGRGQTGNGWESEEDKNLLCSILLPPETEEPFYLTVAVSVALYRVVSEQIWLTTLELDADKPLTIKWPNDLYYGDKKLAGILLESVFSGNKMEYAIAGIGLNVNQTEWHSDAPNPVSLKTICETFTKEDETFDIHELMETLNEELQMVLTEPREITWWQYKAHLYRGEQGPWPFVERAVDTTPTMNAPTDAPNQFMACIKDVLPTGEIILQDEQGKERKYHFKQIRYVI